MFQFFTLGGTCVAEDACSELECGNSVLQPPEEECDDGNLINGDGCSSNCTLELGSCCFGCRDNVTGTREEDTCVDAVSTKTCAEFEPPFCNPGKDPFQIFTLNGTCVDGGSCTELECGNLVLQSPPEECDDGNLIDGDGCSSNCTLETKGSCCFGCRDNTTGTSIELTCIDGVQNQTCAEFDPASCSFQGPFTVPFQTFTLGGTCVAEDACSELECGNSVLQPPEEECDDGNLINGDGCSSNCTLEPGSCCFGCRDPITGTRDETSCVDAVSVKTCAEFIPVACLSEPFTEGFQIFTLNGTCVDGGSCTELECGNLVLQSPEECDDGNLVAGDGCSSNCTIELGACCGQCLNSTSNVTVPGSSQCTDGVTARACGEVILGCNESETARLTFTLDGTCSEASCNDLCGNGMLDPGEECDDGNLIGGDGCSAMCTIERGSCCGGCLDPNTGTRVESTCFDNTTDCKIAGVCILPPFTQFFSTFTLDGVCVNESKCSELVCGNLVLQSPPEECDDGNLIDGDGCSSNCTFEGSCCTQCLNTAMVFLPGKSNCTQSITNSQCAALPDPCEEISGATLSRTFTVGGACNSSTCEGLCGNGILDPGEECDDDNLVGGDGCSATCLNETQCCDFDSPFLPCVSLAPSDAACDLALNKSSCLEQTCCTLEEDTISFTAATDPACCVAVQGIPTTEFVQPCCFNNDTVSVAPECCTGFGGTLGVCIGACCRQCIDDVSNATVPGKSVCQDNMTQSECDVIVTKCGDNETAATTLFERTNCSDVACEGLCGNGELDFGEECDDGNLVDEDGCSAECTFEGACCQQCFDESNVTVPGSSVCFDTTTLVACTFVVPKCGTNETGATTFTALANCSEVQCEGLCGNGELDSGEECDDGNLIDGDGCSSTCTIELGACCGQCLDASNVTVPGESFCEDNSTGTEPGSRSCIPPKCGVNETGVVTFTLLTSCSAALCDGLCGNGELDSGEECDDGNLVDGDGCSSNCTNETACCDEEAANFCFLATPCAIPSLNSTCVENADLQPCCLLGTVDLPQRDAGCCIALGGVIGTCPECLNCTQATTNVSIPVDSDDRDFLVFRNVSIPAVLEFVACSGTSGVEISNDGSSQFIGVWSFDTLDALRLDAVVTSMTLSLRYLSGGGTVFSILTRVTGTEFVGDSCSTFPTTATDASLTVWLIANGAAGTTVTSPDFSTAFNNARAALPVDCITSLTIMVQALGVNTGTHVFAQHENGTNFGTLTIDTACPAATTGSTGSTGLATTGSTGSTGLATTGATTGVPTGSCCRQCSSDGGVVQGDSFCDDTITEAACDLLPSVNCGIGASPGKFFTLGGTCSEASCAGLCGNNVVDPGEECDDGNTNSFDGCSSTCLLETGCCTPMAFELCVPLPPSTCTGSGFLVRTGGTDCEAAVDCCVGNVTVSADPECCVVLNGTLGVCPVGTTTTVPTTTTTTTAAVVTVTGGGSVTTTTTTGVAALCDVDGMINDEETDVDCGGPVCPPCAVGQMCIQDSDCEEELLCTSGGTCVAAASESSSAPEAGVIEKVVVVHDTTGIQIATLVFAILVCLGVALIVWFLATARSRRAARQASDTRRRIGARQQRDSVRIGVHAGPGHRDA